MTDYTTLADGSSSTAKSGVNAAGFPAPIVIQGEFDATKRTLVQNDTVAVLAIPAGTLIQGVMWEVVTVEGANRNFAIGEVGVDTDGWITSTTANALARGATALALTEGTPNTITGLSSGKFYDSADTIDLLAVTSGGLTTCKIKLKAWGWTFGKNGS